jgi:hypothetical protein
MADCIKENYCVMCEPVCSNGPNLVAFLINCNEISVNWPHLSPCSLQVDNKE